MAWLSGWAKRVEVTIDHTKFAVDMWGFPLLLYITEASVFAELGSDSNRRKIAVTESDGTSELQVEIENWDHANSKACLFIETSYIDSAVDTILYLYYDSHHTDNTNHVLDLNTYVWNSVGSYQTVLHLNNDPTSTIYDSSPNYNHGTSGGSMTAGDLVDSQFGKGLDFDNDDDQINLVGGIELTEFTIYVLGTLTAISNTPGICGDQVSYFNGRLAIIDSTHIRWRASDSITLSVPIPTGTQCLLAITRDASNNMKVYLDGIDVTVGAPSFSQTFKLFRVGDNPDNISTNKAWNGILDEFWISDIDHGADWILSTYYSLFDLVNSFGAEEIGEVAVSSPAELSISPLDPSLSPYQILVPVPVPLMLTPLTPFTDWAINESERRVTRKIFICVLSGWYSSEPDLHLPISSFSLRLSRQRARQCPPGTYVSWQEDTEYVKGDIVRPSNTNGCRYQAQNSGRSNKTMVAAIPLYYPYWAGRILYPLGVRVQTTSGYVYRCVNMGWSGSKEPTWGGATVTETTYVNVYGWGSAQYLVWQREAIPGGQEIRPEPNWPLSFGATVNDNDIIWKNIGHDEIWAANTTYAGGERVYPTYEDDFYYICVLGGTSGEVEPTWADEIGQRVIDGAMIWKCSGRAEFFELTELTVTVPANHAGEIAKRAVGDLRLYQLYVHSPTLEGRGDPILQASTQLTDIQIQQAAKSYEITLTARGKAKTAYIGGTREFTLSRYAGIETKNGLLTVDFPEIDSKLKLGDVVTIAGQTFEIDEIVISRSHSRENMQIAER